MATKQITAELLLKGVDKTGRAFASVSRRLGAIDKKAKAVDAHNRRRFTATEKRRIAAIGRTSALVAGVTTYAGKAAIEQAAESERTLTRIGITAEATRAEMETVGRELLKIGDDVSLPYQSMVQGLDSLTASGRNLNESMDFLPSVAATAQASGADITEIATTADAMSRSLKISSGEMQRAFDILVAGGKAGKFELKDMARYLPTLAPAMKALGYEGLDGLKKLIAMLQVVREQTGTAEEAATNYQSVLQKMETDRTAKKFKKFGIDLRKEMEGARAAGKDVLDVFINLANQAVKGDLSKLPQLFADAQMAKGMRALMTGADSMERYVAALKNVDGATMRDLNVLLKDQQAKIDKLSNAWGGLVKKIGSKTSSPVTGAISSVLQGINNSENVDAGLDRYKKRYGIGRWDYYAEHKKLYEKINGPINPMNPVARFNQIDAASSAMGKWAAGGFKGDPLDELNRAIDRVARLTKTYVPGTGDHHPALGNDLGPVVSAGGVPMPLFKSDVAAARRIGLAGQYAQYGQGRQIGEAAALDFVDNRDASAQRKKMMRAGSGDVHSAFNRRKTNVSIETKAAEKNVGALKNLLSDMNGKVEIDTTDAERKIARLRRSIAGMRSDMRALGSSSRADMNTGRSMPQAGAVGGM